MAISPLSFPQYDVNSAADFTPLARLGQIKQQRDGLAEIAARAAGTPAASDAPAAPTRAPFDNSTDLMANRGSNVQSWYDFARRPLEQGGLGLTHEQAVGKVANLQAESGASIPAWGPTGDNGTAHGAAQWRQDRFNNLQQFAADRGLDYRTTAAQQAFMRHEYLGSERRAYDALTSAQTPQQAASAINRYYERSADTTGGREANAARLATQLRLGDQ